MARFECGNESVFQFFIYRVRHEVSSLKVLSKVFLAFPQAGGLILQLPCCQAIKNCMRNLKIINRTSRTDLMPQGVYQNNFANLSLDLPPQKCCPSNWMDAIQGNALTGASVPSIILVKLWDDTIF